MALNICAISGSLRQASFNTNLLKAAQQLAPKSLQLDLRTLHGIPLYDGDVEAATGMPDAVIQLKRTISAADGLLIASPEYNNGVPGVLKNAIDWLSRPGPDKSQVFTGKPLALVGASPGGFGTILSQNAWLPVLRSLGVQHWAGGRLLVSKAHTVFNAEGVMIDETVKAQWAAFLAGFAEFVAGVRASASVSPTSAS